jgi:nucleoside-diphosphate-sugar epimerase
VTLKILVTGGAGFLGVHLAKKLLDNGYNVHLADNFARGVDDQIFRDLLDHSRVNDWNVDLLELQSVLNLDQDYDVIFHLAAIIGVRHVLRNPYRTLDDNVRMLRNTIELGRRQKSLSRFIFSSTSEIYADALNKFNLRIPTPETIPLAIEQLGNPRSSYMLSKLVGEALCNFSDLPWTVVRPHNIFGPRMGLSHVIPELLRKIHEAENGTTIEVFSANHTRTFCYIDDAIEMLQLIMINEDCVHTTLNVGVQTPEITIGSLAKKCISVSKKTILIDCKEDSYSSPKRRCPDMSFTNNLIKYEPETGLEEGIVKTWGWYFENIFSCHGLSAK